MDADDIAHPQRIATQVAYMESHPEIYMCGTQAYVIDSKGKRIGKKNLPLTHEEIYASFFQYNNFVHPSIMARNELTKGVFYHLRFPYYNEYYTFMKFMSEGKRVANLPDRLMYYRIHGDNDSFHGVRRKYLSNIRMRLAFIFECGYRPTLKQLVIFACQSVFVLCMPERIITFAYLVSRKVITLTTVQKQVSKLSRLVWKKRTKALLLRPILAVIAFCGLTSLKK
jgi:hypothetical protein